MPTHPDSNIAKLNRGSKRVDEDGLKKEFSLLDLGSPFDLFDVDPEDMPPLLYEFRIKVLGPLSQMGLILITDSLLLEQFYDTYCQLVYSREQYALHRRNFFSDEFKYARKCLREDKKDFLVIMGKLGFTPQERGNLLARLTPSSVAHGNSANFQELDDQFTRG